MVVSHILRMFTTVNLSESCSFPAVFLSQSESITASLCYSVFKFHQHTLKEFGSLITDRFYKTDDIDARLGLKSIYLP